MKKTGIVKYIIIFIIGCAVGAIFYPSKTVVKTKEVTSEEDKKLISELKEEVSSLKQTNRKLSEKTHTIILEKPDGTKKTEIVRVSDEEESTTEKVKKELQEQLAIYEAEIQKLKYKEKTEINKKKLFFDIGPTVNLTDFKDIGAYGHASYNFTSIFTINGLVQSNFKQNHYIGAGIGGAL